VHWPSDIIFGVLFGLFLAWGYMKIEPRLAPRIEGWSDTKKILYGLLFSAFLIILGFVAFILGTLFVFNEPISLSDPVVWAETDLGTYPGLFAGIVIGQTLEKKHINFTTQNLRKKIVFLRVIIGIVSVVILYFIAKGIDNFILDFQSELVWITQLTNYLSYFAISICLAFLIPILFSRIESKL
jgi:hypothetical protein